MPFPLSRRQFGLGLATAAATAALKPLRAEDSKPRDHALVSITLDLEMSRHFPTWETMHWDYEKGNLDADTKRYAALAGERVKDRGGVIHYFCVARVLEQENVDWLKSIIKAGHSVGNHTYDHVYLLAQKPEEVQFRFARAPWLMRGRPVPEVIADNIRMASEAMQTRLGSAPVGFRTPGGFATGLKGREDIQKMLLDQGFTWVSSLYPPHKNTMPGERPGADVLDSIVAAQAAAQPFIYPTGLVELPMSPISDVGALRTGRWPLEDFLKAIRLALEWTIEHRAVFDFLAHPSCLGVVDPRFEAIDLICDMVKHAGAKARLVDLASVAKAVSSTS